MVINSPTFVKVVAPRPRADIVIKFKEKYFSAVCALNFTTAFELLIATILSAQCTDDRVNQVTAVLFKKYDTAEKMHKATLAAIEKIIYPTGFYRNKALALKKTSETLIRDFHGIVPNTMEELLTLEGVGRKTANVVLGNYFGIASGIVVDTHVSRLSQRLGLTKQVTPEKIAADLEKKIPQEDWIRFSHWLIAHGRSTCKARKPQCQMCFVFDLCPRNKV